METKPGVRTTEFWITLISNIAGALNLAGAWNFSQNKYTVLALAIINGLYAASRGLAKAGVPASVPTDALAGLIASRLAAQPTTVAAPQTPVAPPPA